MKITKRQLRRIIREEKTRILAEKSYNPTEIERATNPDPGIVAETLEELKAEGAIDKIRDEVSTAATIIANISDEMDIALMDAGLSELAMDLRKAEKLLNEISDATGVLAHTA